MIEIVTETWWEQGFSVWGAMLLWGSLALVAVGVTFLVAWDVRGDGSGRSERWRYAFPGSVATMLGGVILVVLAGFVPSEPITRSKTYLEVQGVVTATVDIGPENGVREVGVRVDVAPPVLLRVQGEEAIEVLGTKGLGLTLYCDEPDDVLRLPATTTCRTQPPPRGEVMGFELRTEKPGLEIRRSPVGSPSSR